MINAVSMTGPEVLSDQTGGEGSRPTPSQLPAPGQTALRGKIGELDVSELPVNEFSLLRDTQPRGLLADGRAFLRSLLKGCVELFEALLSVLEQAAIEAD